MSSELVGYMRSGNHVNFVEISVLKEAMDKADTYESKDGSKFIKLYIRKDKLNLIMNDTLEVTSVVVINDVNKTDGGN